MPSKTKKNRRRMKRARALKAALEEQHAANPQVKASRGLAVGAPPATNQKKPVKKPAPAPSPASAPAPCLAPTPVVEEVPAKVPETIPGVVPIAKDEPKPTVPEKVAETVQVKGKSQEPVLIEETPGEVEVQIQTTVTEEEKVIQTQVLEPPTVEAVAELKTEPAILEPKAVTEVSPPAEGPVEIPAETPLPAVENTVLSEKAEQALDVCEPEVELEASVEEDSVTEVEAEEIPTATPVTEAEEPPVEAPTDEADTVEVEAEIVPDIETGEDITETQESVTETEQVEEVEVKDEEDEAEVEVLPKEDTTQASAELVTESEVPTVIPEAPKEEIAAAVTEVPELSKDSLVDDLIANESAKTLECQSVEAAAVQQEAVTSTDTPTVQTESMDVPPAKPESIVAQAEGVADDSSIGLLPEEPTSNVCDMACQMQLSVDPVQISSVEMSMDTTLNTHMAPEVPIEG